MVLELAVISNRDREKSIIIIMIIFNKKKD